MTITRVSKGTPHDLYNYFVTNPKEYIVSSDWIEFIPDPNYNFKKEIKNDFIV
jgi:hypothetical protein